MIDTPEVVQTRARTAAVLHVTVPRQQIREVMEPGYREVMETLAAQGLAPAGPWFTHHLKMDPDTFDFEIGVPVDATVATSGRVRSGELPAVRAARTVYHGSYEGLGNAWAEFDRWIASEGLAPAGDLWEIYVAGAESTDDPSSFRTELNRPLTD